MKSHLTIWAALGILCIAFVVAWPETPTNKVHVEGVAGSHFEFVGQYISGLTTSNEVVETKIATKTGYIISKIPGRLEYGDIKLKRARTDNLLYSWNQLVVNGQIATARKDLTLAFLDAGGHELQRFTLTNVWPSVYAVAGSSEAGSQYPYEYITLTCETIVREP